LDPDDQPPLHRHPSCLRPRRRGPPGSNRGRARSSCPSAGADHGDDACPDDGGHAGGGRVSLPVGLPRAASAALPRLFHRFGGDPPLGLFAILILLGAGLSFISPYFLTTTNLLNIGRGIAIVGIVAVGETIVIISGGFDLSVGSVMAAAGMTAGWMVTQGIP